MTVESAASSGVIADMLAMTGKARPEHRRHATPPGLGLALGEPDGRPRRGIQYAVVYRFDCCRLSITVIASASEAIQSCRSKKAGLLRR